MLYLVVISEKYRSLLEVSTSKGKDCKPYWSDLCEAISSRLFASRLRCKIKNLVKELHHKTARFLVDNFEVILLPTFETSQMVSKSRRKLRNKSVRQMLTLSHYEFKTFLKWKAWQQSKTVIDCNEAYTSKTVSWTGEIVKNLGGAKTIKSLSTGLKMNRDLNGARGIFLAFGNAKRERALVDTPWLKSQLAL